MKVFRLLSLALFLVASTARAQTPSSADSYFDAANPVTPLQTKVPSSLLSLTPTNNKLYGFSLSTGASAGRVMIFTTSTPPSDGAVTPALCYVVAANSTASVSYGNTPVYTPQGVSIVFSTGADCFTKTSSSTAFISALVF